MQRLRYRILQALFGWFPVWLSNLAMHVSEPWDDRVGAVANQIYTMLQDPRAVVRQWIRVYLDRKTRRELVQNGWSVSVVEGPYGYPWIEPEDRQPTVSQIPACLAP